MTKDEALKLALEALEADELDMVDDGSGNMVFRKEIAITAIKDAYAQPEQEPVAYYHPHKKFYWAKPTRISATTAVDVKPLPLYTIPPEFKQPTKIFGPNLEELLNGAGFYRKKEWVGLSDEETETLIHRFDGDPHTLLDEVNARLKEKNT